MLLHVREYNLDQDYHVCRDEQGDTHRVDLMVDGGFCGTDITPRDLVGLTVEYEYLYPHVEIAHGVRIHKEGDPR